MEKLRERGVKDNITKTEKTTALPVTREGVLVWLGKFT